MSKDKKKKLQGFDKAVLKRVLTHIKKYRILVILSFVCAMITVASTLYAPILTGDAIDLIVGKGLVDFDGIKDIIYTFVMVTVVTVLSQWFMNIINNHITYSVVRDIRIEVFNHMEELPLSYIDSHKHGDIVSRIVSDIDQFADGLLMGFTQLFTGIVTILATLGFMIAVNVPIALVVIVLTPLSLFVASFIAKRTYHLFHRQSETRGDITSLVDEMIGQQKIVQAFGYEDEALERFGEINDRLEKDSMSATFYSSIVNPCTRFLNNLVYAAVGIIGAVSVISTGFTVGQLTCFLSYANQYTKPFNEISNVITELQNAMACAGRVFELLDETPQVPEKENAHVLTDTKGAIEIKGVNFSYVKDKTLITNLNLSVKPGMRVAIVGPTGCGKSTLINLSQGQKQLLCITRVMLLLPPMLILDEATSSIDTRTEIRIQKAFNRMMQGRTSFIVAHRLSTIREADVILVMKDGNIIEKGNHDQLMAQNGFYTNLYNSQFAH